jgi:hypothetical protein
VPAVARLDTHRHAAADAWRWDNGVDLIRVGEMVFAGAGARAIKQASSARRISPPSTFAPTVPECNKSQAKYPNWFDPTWDFSIAN